MALELVNKGLSSASEAAATRRGRMIFECVECDWNVRETPMKCDCSPCYRCLKISKIDHREDCRSDIDSDDDDDDDETFTSNTFE